MSLNEGIEKKCRTKLIACVILIVAFIAENVHFNYIVEQMKREQARNNLKQVQYCYNNIVDEFGVKSSLKTCTDKTKTSFTGDVYVINSATLEFVYETSSDVPSKELYFTKDSVGKYFKDWDSGKKALNVILLGKDSVRGVDVEYNFDGETEWLEWIYLPNESTRNNPLIAVHGTQSDEVMKNFTHYKILNISTTLIIILLLLTSISVGNKNDKSR